VERDEGRAAEAPTAPPRRAARAAAWAALAVATAAVVNAIATAAIVSARDYERFTPKSPVVRMYNPYDPNHDFARQGIASMTTLSCVGAFFALVLGVAARRLQRRPGIQPAGAIANSAIATALLAAIIAVVASLVCGWQLTPWPFG
jgi:hypothetical protein